MFLLTKLYNYARKHPFRVGLGVMIIYACCSSEVMSMLKNVVGMGQKILKPTKESLSMKRDQLIVPDMDDVSMYAESKSFTSKVAQKNAKLEDIVDEAHK